MSTAIIYKGDGSFDDLFEPVASKSEWGMDMLERVMSGSQPNLVPFVKDLAQGQSYLFNSNRYYLQSWSCDNNPVFPKVTLIYKGLFAGIPAPFVSGTQIDQTFSISCSSPQNASRDIRYLTRSSEYKYIAAARPTGPTYETLDVAISIFILQSVVRTADGQVYFGSVPAPLLTALTPGTSSLSLMSCAPVFGTPFFECTDVVTLIFV